MASIRISSGPLRGVELEVRRRRQQARLWARLRRRRQLRQLMALPTPRAAQAERSSASESQNINS